MPTHKLHHPAPARASVELGAGKYYLRQWTVLDVREALRAGMWFTKGRHEFASREAALAAGVGARNV